MVNRERGATAPLRGYRKETHMHLARRLTLALAVAAVALAALAATASASQQPASGTFTEGPQTISEARQSGGNLFLRFTRNVTLTGTYDGVGLSDERLVIHKDGSLNIHGTIDFVGTACGQPVHLIFNLVARGSVVGNVVIGSYTVIRGGDPETGVGRGNGKIAGTLAGGVYSGRVHCD
jgi:hypothetical protein